MPTAFDQKALFCASDVAVRELAERFGTPLYVLSEEIFRSRIRRYKTAFSHAYSKVELSYASKANGTLALLAIAAAEGLLIDVVSEGELRAAMKAGVPASRCEFHGSNKTVDELQFALDSGIRTIIIDSFEEIARLRLLYNGSHNATRFVLRLAPGVDPITHERISTGREDSKFGFNIADGSAERALASTVEAGLPVVGFHCHVGSQLLDPEAQRAGGEALANFALKARDAGFEAQVINLGGGLGIDYGTGEHPMEVEEYCDLVCSSVMAVLQPAGMRPTLMQEPGRYLCGPSGSTIYQVGVVKTVPTENGSKTYVSVDGGLSDNPRPALYGAQYQILHIPQSNRTTGSGELVVTIAGKHCETDELFHESVVSEDIKPGDFIQVLSTGAYNSSMASTYNRYPLPATVLVRANGDYEIVQKRQTFDELLAREVVPEDLQ